jgi:hypothetical protein
VVTGAGTSEPTGATGALGGDAARDPTHGGTMSSTPLDIDFNPTPDTRPVQFTLPGSPASIQFGEGTTTMAGPLQRLLLIVDDIEAARDDLVSRGVDVSEIFHNEPGKGPTPGLDPERRSYASLASFSDPDGNQWVLQEITERLPGRV